MTHEQHAALIDRIDKLVTMLALLVAEQSRTTAALNALADAIAAPVEEAAEAAEPGQELDFDGQPIR